MGEARPVGQPERVARPSPPRSIWTLLTSTKQEKALQKGLLLARTSYPFMSFESRPLSPAAKAEIVQPWRDWEERESATLVRAPSFVEPEYGWVICKPAHLVDSCLIDSAFAPRPRFSQYLAARVLKSREIRREKTLIHLRSWGESNYWHFLNDLVGGRLRLAELCGLQPDIPILLGRRAYDMPFVRELADRGALGRRRLIVQGGEYIQADEVVVFSTARSNRQNIDFVLERLNAPNGDAQRARRIFLSREEASGRTISNRRDVIAVCQEFGFEIVTTERMTVADQMRLFAEVGYLVAIHGAGLINMMFRRGASLRILEIFPPSERLSWGTTPPHYCFMAQALGFAYDALIAKETRDGDYRTAFWVDPAILRARIQAMFT